MQDKLGNLPPDIDRVYMGNVPPDIDQLIERLRARGQDIEEIEVDDNYRHFAQWIERTEKDNGPMAIWFYVDNTGGVHVEAIGPSRD